ncbi:MAG: permease [Gammaproteobacteria bacterium]|nr:permease [Gammaproteobacteria bacterium]NIR83650.1 permease [Gammaproteobacteria bacterium]NIR91625.1 permease [Gammaproteobacteria bacterium]NIU04812.1 permease [Gammaproteobacteria bacterium]NIV51798.1 permease [Gammaproteobacteria bacterium]
MNTQNATALGWYRRVSSLDPAWLGLASIFAALLVLTPAQLERSLTFTLDSLVGVSPFLLLSIGLAAYAKASSANNLIARAFHGRAVIMVVFAAAIGALSPFCSCGVIPLIAALLGMGVPLAPVMAFWLASPLMDPSMFALTLGTLGAPFAIAKTASAAGIGMLGGFGIWLLQTAGLLREPLRAGVGNGGCAGSVVREVRPVAWPFWRESARRKDFVADARFNLAFLGKWLTLAFVLESLMLAYVPADAVADIVGRGDYLEVVAAALVGIPAYLNGYAALPLVGGLMEQGMAPGAAMAFLLAGGVTSIPAAVAVYALARRPVFVAYIAFALIGAVTAGLVYGAT